MKNEISIENNSIEVSVVIPCLNEEKGVGICVEKCFRIFQKYNINGEVVVSDNGSSDNSVSVAQNAGARVVHQIKKGYGNAYLKGFSEARGKYIIMADADDTYDFLELDKFVTKLREGFNYVSGNRLNKLMKSGAMPWSHRWIGNPVITFLLNLMFGAKVSDAYCGMRGMTREAYDKLNIRSTGWEFALEMEIKASKYKLNIADVSITYYPRKGDSKLNTFSDGWRSLRFMLLFSPLYLFLLPGLMFFFLGILLLVLYFINSNFYLWGVNLDGYPLFLSSLLIIIGYQIIAFGFSSKLYAINNNYDTSNSIIDFLFSKITLEDGLIFGFFILLFGLFVSLTSTIVFPVLGIHSSNIINGVLSLTLIMIGFQTIFSSFFLSIFGLKKK